MSQQVITKLRLKDALIIALGAALLTIAVKYILDPSGLVTGGVSGLSIIVKYVTDKYFPYTVPLWMTNVILNIPIFIYAMYVDGKRSVVRTGLAFIINSVLLYVLPDVDLFPSDNLFLVSLFGGILFGLSTGILLSVRATSGGTDLLAKSLHSRFRSLSMGRIIQILDGIIVLIGLLTFGVEKTLYAIVAVYVMGRVADMIIDRGKHAKMCIIFSDKNDLISQDILNDMERGCTALMGKGMYSGEKKDVLMCVCSHQELPDIKDIVKLHDKKAFFIVANISEAMGEGFVEHWSSKT